MMLRPTWSLEFPTLELSRMRALSSAEAQRKTILPVYSRSALVCASTIRTPVMRFLLES